MQDLDLKSKNRAAVVVVWWSIPLKLMAVDLYVVFMCLDDIGQRYFWCLMVNIYQSENICKHYSIPIDAIIFSSCTEAQNSPGKWPSIR